MAEQLISATIAAPGFAGVNTQESSIQLDSGFASQAYNCVIDKFGRIGSRKDWSKVNAVNTDLGSNPIQFMFEMIDPNGNQLISARNNKLFTGTTTLTQKTVRNQANSLDLTYNITANHWQGAAIPYGDGSAAIPHAYLVQAGHPMLIFHNLPTPGTGATFSVTTVNGSGGITALSVTAAGSGYNVGDVLTLSNGTTAATVTVATLSGSGVATVTITTEGAGYSALAALTSTVTTIATPHSHTGSYGFQRLGDVGSLPTGYSTSSFTPNCALSAYGRIWVADIVGDRQTVYFSRLLDGSDFTGGDSGSLALNTVFPNNDQIVALGAHNGFLIIFGRNNIAIFSNPIDVTTLVLQDFIPNVGCISRDSVVSTGTDVLFLSDGGLRSLTRVIQEKSLPFRDLSKNVRDELMARVNSETTKIAIKGVYFESDAFYLLMLPTVKEIYCFDLRTFLPDGASRVTIWNKVEPKSFVVTNAKKLYLGMTGYIGEYKDYLDDTSTYRMIYYTNYFDLGEATTQKILKKVNWVLIGGSGQEVVTKYGFDYKDAYRAVTEILPVADVDEYNVGEYNIAEFSSNRVVAKFSEQMGGTGSVIQLGFETEINTEAVSIQKIDCYTKLGKMI